jgi:hypothetical protein
MHYLQKFTLFQLGFVMVLLLSGCFLPGDNDSRGVKLSDAMKSSASGDRKDLGRTVQTENDNDDKDGDASTHVSVDSNFSGGFYKKAEYAWQFPADVSYVTPFNGDIQGMTRFTLTPLAVEDEYSFFGFYAGGASLDLKSGSLPDLAIEDPFILRGGLIYRRYLNSSRPALSPYVTTSVGYESLWWRYRNSIVVGDDTISGDILSAWEGYVGFGVSTRRDQHVSFFAEVGVGGMVFDGTTEQGFDNDVFDEFGYFSFKAGASLKF